MQQHCKTMVHAQMRTANWKKHINIAEHMEMCTSPLMLQLIAQAGAAACCNKSGVTNEAFVSPCSHAKRAARAVAGANPKPK